MITFDNVHKRFGDHHVLRGVSFDVQPGTVHFVMGRSGAGKSVLTKQLVGLLRPDAGAIWFDGRDVTSLDEAGFSTVRQRCQMIFQHSTLFESLTVLENVAMPIRKRFRSSRADADEQARVALQQVHAENLAARFPPDLGAGIRKRVAIARAIALKPEVLLYDEPTTSLDPVAARRTDRLVAEMARTLGITSMVVSHDLDSLTGIADRVTFLHEGAVHFDGVAADMLSSDDPILRSFVGNARSRWDWRRGSLAHDGGAC